MALKCKQRKNKRFQRFGRNEWTHMKMIEKETYNNWRPCLSRPHKTIMARAVYGSIYRLFTQIGTCFFRLRRTWLWSSPSKATLISSPTLSIIKSLHLSISFLLSERSKMEITVALVTVSVATVVVSWRGGHGEL